MSSISLLFVLTAGLCGALATIAIWSRRRMLPKITALIAAIMLLPVNYASFAELLSKPKPIDLEWWLGKSDEATVVSSLMREGEGIFLWLQLTEVTEPRSYVLPWDQELAKELQKAQEEAEENNSELRMRLPFEKTLDDREPKFYALPQVAPPAKDGEEHNPQMYEQPGRDA